MISGDMQVLSTIDSHLPRWRAPWWFLLCVFLVLVIAILDYLTGHELSLSVLYLAPVVLAAWVLGRDGGIAISMTATITWLVSVVFMGLEYSHPFYYFWDAAITFLTFVLFALIIARLKLALEHADERFLTVLEGLDSAVFVTDDRGALLYGNEQYYRSAEQGIALLNAVREVVQMPGPTATLHAGAREGEFHDAERRRWYLVRSRTIRWVDGKRVRLHRANDITERKQAEELSRQQQEKLQMTSRLITVGEMASTLAHEMNQPLAAIANYTKGCVRRLRSGNWNAAELLDALDKTALQAERAGKVIQRVRGFLSKRDPVFSACDVNDIIRGVVTLIEIEAENNGVAITLELERALPRARCDAIMIEQVVLNLAKNAIEAMQEVAMPSRRLVFRTSLGTNDTVHVVVSDSGPGVPENFEEKLLAPFYTTKALGMGLGLHICRSIIEAHAGRLWATRNPEGGARLVFSLPVAAP
jgi:signal transduction histidine kinase